MIEITSYKRTLLIRLSGHIRARTKLQLVGKWSDGEIDLQEKKVELIH